MPPTSKTRTQYVPSSTAVVSCGASFGAAVTDTAGRQPLPLAAGTPTPTPSGTAALCSVTVTVPACEVTNDRDAEPVVPRCVVQLTVVGEVTDVGAVVSDSSPQDTVQKLASSTQTVTHRAVVVTSERTEWKTPRLRAVRRCR